MLTQLTEDEVIPQPLPAKPSAIGRKALAHFIHIALFLVVLDAFVPLHPLMPANGLDMSWMFAMNQGVAHGFVFGKDVVFTFGPYSSIYTQLYDPATDRLMIYGSLFLGLCYVFSLLLLAKGKSIYGLLLYAVFLAHFSDSRDALLFSYPLILSLVAYRITLPAGHEWKLNLAPASLRGAAILFAPLGLLPLIKGSLLPMCGVLALFCFALFWWGGKRFLSVAAVGVPAISCALLWRISGQPLRALPGFFLSMRQIISGYNEAMSFPGNSWECVFYLLAAAILIFTIIRSAHAPRPSIRFLWAIYAFFLFLAFKSGFVRHDPWHNIIAGTSILAAALLLVFVLNFKSAIFPVAAALLVWTYIGHGPTLKMTGGISLNPHRTFADTVHGIRARLANNGSLQNEYAAHLAAIEASFPIPSMPGTTDIYPINQSWVLASGNTWAPRPVPQSYSAYTPELEELNLHHLEGSAAPDNIVFRVEPIDHRLPSMEDGLSWRAILDGYSFQKLDGDSVYLRKKKGIANISSSPLADFYIAKFRFGAEIPLPESNDPVFARLEIEPTFIGRIWSALFKPPELQMVVRTRDGKRTQYRIISLMVKSDFLISPLVKSAADFALLAVGGNKYLAGTEVKSISVFSDDRSGMLWNSTYTLSLRKDNLLRGSDINISILNDKRLTQMRNETVDPNRGNISKQ